MGIVDMDMEGAGSRPLVEYSSIVRIVVDDLGG